MNRGERLSRTRQWVLVVLAGFVATSTGCGLFGLFPTNPVPTRDANEVFELAGERFTVEAFVTGLEVPWSIDFTPDGERMIVTERPGRLRVIELATGSIVVTSSIADVAPQLPRFEQGLMGLAVSPEFEQDRLVFVSYTTPVGLGVKNVIDRFRLESDRFVAVGEVPIVDNLPGFFIHDGLPIHFGPDGKLYAATGEATQRDRAQDLDFLGGKFLRMNPDGTVPEDNPFGDSLIWSIGHRNPQGFGFHPERDDLLISTEHGSSRGLDGAGGEDEINRILPGRNYGWPDVRGDETAEGIEEPLWQSGTEPIAPAGGTFCTGRRYPNWTNAFLFVGLRGASLWVVKLGETEPIEVVSIERGLRDVFGRLRGIAEGPDGLLYLSTSNRDSRGTPASNDDRILRLVPVDG